MSKIATILLAFFLSFITALGDAFIKKASLQKDFSGKWWLVSGAIFYAITALGWFYILKKMKLSIAVIIYTVSLVLIVVAISFFYFKEKISLQEMAGVALAIISLLLLYKYL